MNLAASYLSLNKYSKKQPMLNEVTYAKASKFLQTHFSMCRTTLWSFDRCVEQLEPNSSPGYPLSKTHPLNRDVVSDPELLSCLEGSFNKGEFLSNQCVWSNSLKEEIRPKEKILKNKIRTFTAAPITFTLLASRVCGSFNEDFYAACDSTASCVGKDLFHLGWHDLYVRLCAHPHAFELDESEYDSSLCRRFLYTVAEFRFHQSDGSDVSRDLIFSTYSEIVNSVIVTADGNVVVKGTGNPSGSFNTIVDNTLILFLLLSYAWIELVNDSYEDFMANVVLLLTGDDNTFSVSDAFVDRYNARNIANCWARIGVTTTSPCYDPQRPDQVSFLSRSFSHEFCGFKVPVLQREKLVKSLIYSEHPNDPAYCLQRIGGMRNVSFFDFEMMEYLDFLVAHIYAKYDAVLSSNEEYCNAKKGILGVDQLIALYMCREELSNDVMPPKILFMDNQSKHPPRPTGKNSRKPSKKEYLKKKQLSTNANPRAEAAKVRGLIKAEMKLVRHQTTKLTPQAKAILANLALPSDAKAVRTASASGSDPTALANLRARETVIFPQAVWDTPTTSHITCIYRDPLRHMIQTYGMTAAQSYVYSAPFTLHSGNQDGTFYPSYTNPFRPAGGNIEPHGDELYTGVLGDSDPYRGILITNGTNLTVYNDALIALVNYDVQLYRLEGKAWIFKESKVWASASSVNFGIGQTGYYAISVRIFGSPAAASADALIQGDVVFSKGGVGATWAQRAAPQLADFKENIRMYSVLGSAGMYTNTASPLNRQGKILAREMPAKSHFLEFLDFDTVANLSLASVKDAPTGMYGFTRPEASNFGKTNTLIYDATNDSEDEYVFRLYPEDPYILFHASITTTAGQDAYFTRHISLEYTSLSMFIDQVPGNATMNDVRVALKLLSRMPQFHENPLHLEDIWGWIKDTARDIWSGIKDVAPIALAAAPLLL